MNVEKARFNMIEQQIRPWNVLDTAVLELLSIVRREDFVPPAYRGLAFMDIEVPIGDGQTMLTPRVEARMLQEAGVHRHETALEIGAGSGFMAALLSHRARSVVALELRPALARMAADNLRRGGIANATVRQADGAAGRIAEGPFDAIVMSGSVAEVPRSLLDQLKPGGRLLAIVGQEPVMTAVRITRLSGEGFRTESLFDTVAPRLEGFAEPGAFQF
jgi:protein-L-isoaspartate(D-aspartate) O-methyltransferase